MATDGLIGWGVLSTLTILIQTVTDVKNLQVDERKNYLLMGYALFAAVSAGLGILDLVLVSVTVGVLAYAFARSKVLAKGDRQAVYALVLGNYAYGGLVLFLVLLGLAVVAAYAVPRVLGKKVERVPAYPLILCAQVLTVVGLATAP